MTFTKNTLTTFLPFMIGDNSLQMLRETVSRKEDQSRIYRAHVFLNGRTRLFVYTDTGNDAKSDVINRNLRIVCPMPEEVNEYLTARARLHLSEGYRPDRERFEAEARAVALYSITLMHAITDAHLGNGEAFYDCYDEE